MNRDKIWHLFARKLSGESSRDELQELQSLVEEDSPLKYEMDAITQLWEQQHPQDTEYLEATYHLHYEKMKKLGVAPVSADNEVVYFQDDKRRTIKKSRLIAAVVLAGLIVTAAFVFLKPGKLPAKVEAAEQQAQIIPNEIKTKRGSNTQFKLPDGSTVWLNADSKLNYSKINATGVREVYLTGEAFFDVVRNPERPFIIHTESIDIKVLGTTFNVKAYPDDKTIETSLIHGSVEVMVKSRPHEKYLLKPNQKLVLMNEQYAEKREKDQRVMPVNIPIVFVKQINYLQGDTAARETSWVRNKLSFEDEPFAELAKRLERWYDVSIEFKNKEIEEIELSGSFEQETLTQVLEAVRFINNYKFKYKIEGKQVVIF
ncbi:MAG: DUF4974 domain-containing protein [Chitinophagaceae bacterium]|jgi:transmembrane sensor|nr:DUF4974 domain-containing protein [Chitinophagaceae bacterium]